MDLDDILVVSIEQAVAAPFCTQRLADAGARVIKIERPEGQFARGYDAAAKDHSFGAVNSLDDLPAHPELRRQAVTTPQGEVALPAAPVRFFGAGRPSSEVPAPGEHNASIRSGFA